MGHRSAKPQRRCPSCGFWLETVADARAPSHGAALSAIGSIPILGNVLGLLMLRDDLRQASEGPFWCWRCKREVGAREIAAHAP
jgi:hypothetical protein